MASTFSVFYDGSLWVGVYEISEGGHVRAAKYTFGSEPTAAELWDFTRTHANRLIDEARAAPLVPQESPRPRQHAANPKRLARQVSKMQRNTWVTHSQEALAAAREACAEESAALRRHRREENAEKQRAVLVKKRKAKHRGH